MAPKPKPNPNRLGPPPQLNSLKMFPVVHQKFAKKMQPKMREVVTRHIKILAKWFHTQFSWKKFLLFWMVLLIASKMVLLMLTYQFFSLTSLVSLEIFHGVWTLAFFVLTLVNTKTVASPQYQIGYPSMDERERREINNTTMGYEEAIDLEPIDFEHFIDEPDLDRPNMEKMFRVTYGEGVMRGR